MNADEYREAAGLIDLIGGANDWVATSAICEAVFDNRRGPAATVNQWRALADRLDGVHSRIHSEPGAGQPVRLFSREALVMIGMTGRLPFNDAFRRWACRTIVDGLLAPRSVDADAADRIEQEVAAAVRRVLRVRQNTA
ncbi:hypothetical protein [Sphingopyxis granuli]|uniref:hypothetical protein n=1 Tax=Sphingopyxis granuli TaxID=267128 RepID=UPI001BAF7906|nr:hypothetical protein [Sphingopyxis granuli]QUM72167.1 hypothetical protein ICN83_18045 [Sphingopyxis granuli]